MTLFWILATAMLIVAIGLLIPPLFGRRALHDQDRRLKLELMQTVSGIRQMR